MSPRGRIVVGAVINLGAVLALLLGATASVHR